MINVVEADVKGKLQAAQRPVAVVFAKPGFAPSDELVASLREAEKQLGGKIDVLQVELAKAARLAAELRIFQVPELLVFAPGGDRLLGRMEGAMRPDETLDFLNVASSR